MGSNENQYCDAVETVATRLGVSSLQISAWECSEKKEKYGNIFQSQDFPKHYKDAVMSDSD